MDGDMDWLIVPFALIYAVVFWVVSLRIPSVPMALILGLAPFQNDISGFGGLHFSISEIPFGIPPRNARHAAHAYSGDM